MSYRRKSDQAIEKIEQDRKQSGLSPVMPLWISLASAVLIFVLVSYFPARFQAPLGFSLTSLLVALASGLGIFVFLFAMQVLMHRNLAKERRPEICSRCFRPGRDDAERCPCGGAYEPEEWYEKGEARTPPER